MAGDPTTLRRAAIAAAALAIYGVGASWIVGREAASYREGLARVANEPATAPVNEVATAAKPPTSAPEVPPIAKLSPPPVETPVATMPSPAVRPAPEPPAAVIAKAPASEKAEPEPKLGPDPFAGLPVKQAWDLSTKNEFAYGQAMHAMILAAEGESPDEAAVDRLRGVAKPLLEYRSKQANARALDYQFTVLPSMEWNAFSTPGGFIYVTEGLVLSIPEGKECMLQYVLAHEMGHVEKGHAIDCLNPITKALQARSKTPPGTMELHYRIVIPNSPYTDEQEYDADRWALQALADLKYNRFERLAFLREFARRADKGNFKSGRAKLDLKPDRSILDNHYRAHTSITDRLKRAEAYVDGTPAPKSPQAPRQ